nr:MAG TPA: hypothetical protein [Caudoviricetes sp.]
MVEARATIFIIKIPIIEDISKIFIFNIRKNIRLFFIV